ncbi:hypothetical protein SAMN02910353_00918 [Ruminococcus sp. YRD2003]|nr:hypothetical protein SAMN02910353_00918 [Ruminococcus flavefaciens]
MIIKIAMQWDGTCRSAQLCQKQKEGQIEKAIPRSKSIEKEKLRSTSYE